MSIRKRLLLYALLFAAASVFALLFAARPLAPDYTIMALGSLQLGEADDDAASRAEDRVVASHERLASPVSVEQGDSLGIISEGSVVSFPRVEYAMLGDGMVATGDPAEDEADSSRLITAAGGVFAVEHAQRIWQRRSQVLAFGDGGRTVADLSGEIPEGENGESWYEPSIPEAKSETATNGDQEVAAERVDSRIRPDWFRLPGPATAAAATGSAAVIGDALGGLTVAQNGEMEARFELLESGEQGTILALASPESGGDESGSALYAVTGYDPTTLSRVNINNVGDSEQSDGEPALVRTAEVDLPGSVNRPVHLRAVHDYVVVAVGDALLVYDEELELIGHRSFDTAIRDIGFLGDDRLVFVYREGQEDYTVDVLYIDDLEKMYSLSFPRPVDSIRAADGALVTGDSEQTLMYAEIFR